MPEDIVVGLRTLTLRGQIPAMRQTDTAIRAHSKRVFTEGEWKFLNTLPTPDLWRRHGQGAHLIGLLYRPEMLNMTPRKASEISSNLRYQMDEIMRIIDSRKGADSGLYIVE